VTDPRPILIGQAPGPNTNPDLPLYPRPRQSGGGRLWALTGLTAQEYLRCFQRVNLLYTFPGRWKRDDRWPRKEAAVAARAMLPFLEGRTVVFVGRNVARAFEVDEREPWFTWGRREYRYVAIPHPSGRNHWYNRDDNRLISQAFWETLKKDLPFLQGSDKMGTVSYIHGSKGD
jgi:hypothetical protein